MKTLTELIDKYKYNYSDECLFKHIVIENITYRYLTESKIHGLFSLVRDISKKICDELLIELNKRQIDRQIKIEINTSSFNTSFCQNIICNIVYNLNGALQCSYLSNKSTDNEIQLNLNLPKGISLNNYIEKLKRQLHHELTHTYEKYCREINHKAEN